MIVIEGFTAASSRMDQPQVIESSSYSECERERTIEQSTREESEYKRNATPRNGTPRNATPRNGTPKGSNTILNDTHNLKIKITKT